MLQSERKGEETNRHKRGSKAGDKRLETYSEEKKQSNKTGSNKDDFNVNAFLHIQQDSDPEVASQLLLEKLTGPLESSLKQRLWTQKHTHAAQDDITAGLAKGSSSSIKNPLPTFGTSPFETIHTYNQGSSNTKLSYSTVLYDAHPDTVGGALTRRLPRFTLPIPELTDVVGDDVMILLHRTFNRFVQVRELRHAHTHLRAHKHSRSRTFHNLHLSTTQDQQAKQQQQQQQHH
jgi:hypothetical protein